jgi:hypothetical protein
MKEFNQRILVAGLLFFFSVTTTLAQNPLIRDQYTADPSARVFGDRVYIYRGYTTFSWYQKTTSSWQLTG